MGFRILGLCFRGVWFRVRAYGTKMTVAAIVTILTAIMGSSKRVLEATKPTVIIAVLHSRHGNQNSNNVSIHIEELTNHIDVKLCCCLGVTKALHDRKHNASQLSFWVFCVLAAVRRAESFLTLRRIYREALNTVPPKSCSSCSGRYIMPVEHPARTRHT